MPTQIETNAISLTEAAAKEIKDIVTAQDLPAESTYLRVGVKGGGCSGFGYMLDLVDASEDGAVTDSDEVIESQGIKIICDEKSLLYLSGVQIDHKDETMQRGFVFKNPNASSTCGCGSSFSV